MTEKTLSRDKKKDAMFEVLLRFWQELFLLLLIYMLHQELAVCSLVMAKREVQGT